MVKIILKKHDSLRYIEVEHVIVYATIASLLALRYSVLADIMNTNDIVYESDPWP